MSNEAVTRTRSQTVRRRVLIALTAVAAVAAIVVAAAWVGVSSIVGGVTRVSSSAVFPAEATRPEAVVVHSADDESDHQPLNILVMGTDSRAGVGDEEALTSGEATGQRSDTMMLVNISADRSQVTAISIMRDSWVEIPGYGYNKINAALSFGGTPLAVETVEQLTGARIDHVAVLDFEAVESITEALGGVQVDSPVAFTSRNMKGYSFTKGTNTLSGEAALAFVRERYAFADGDYQRVKNQRALVSGVADALFASASDFDIAAFTAAARAASDNLVVDDGLDIPTLLSLGRSLAAIDRDDVIGITLPSTGTGTSPDGQSIVVLDDTAVAGVVDALHKDDLLEYARAHDLAD